jgi:hypothetical protein
MDKRLLSDEQLLKLRATGDIHQAINAQLLYTDIEWVAWGEAKCTHAHIKVKRECMICWQIRIKELDSGKI